MTAEAAESSAHIPEQPTPAEEISTELQAALPMLTSLGGTRRVPLRQIEMLAPSSMSELPAQRVVISRYGNVAQDHRLSGVWKLELDGGDKVYVWSHEPPNGVPEVALKDHINKRMLMPEGDVPEERALEAVRWLRTARELYEREVSTGPPKAKKLHGIGRLVLGHRRG